MKSQIELLLKEVLLSEFSFSDVSAALTIPEFEDHGDYSTNVALQMAKKLQLSPRIVAERIQRAFPVSSVVEKIEIAGPGFLNFFIKSDALLPALQKFDTDVLLVPEKKEKICIDFSSPNIAKPLHFGNLRSTIIGESMRRILIHAGHHVFGDNFLGNWGTQFGKLIVAVRKWGDMEQIAKNPTEELVALYRKFHDEVERNPELEKEGAEEFRKMEVEGDKENLTLWKWIVDISLEELQKFYDRLGVYFDAIRGEQFYEQFLPSTLQKIETIGEISEGALIVRFPKEENEEEEIMTPLVFRRSDGATLYQTRDMAKILFYEAQGFERMLYVVGNEQSLHFRQIFETARKLGVKMEFDHISFGLVRLKDGKMSARKGNVITTEEVFSEAISRVQNILSERVINLSQSQRDLLAENIAIGAIKFNDLCQNRATDIIFDWEKMLSFEGYSGPFLQYSYARAKSILRKAETIGEFSFDGELEVFERRLVKKILDFPLAVHMAAETRRPNLIAQYLFELAQIFNGFYQNLPILKASENDRNKRLFLVQKTSLVLAKGLYLLGIVAPEEM
jgi:arginyl-tRNA synthetase